MAADNYHRIEGHSIGTLDKVRRRKGLLSMVGAEKNRIDVVNRDEEPNPVSASQNEQRPSTVKPDIERYTDLCRRSLADPDFLTAILEILEQPTTETD